MRASPLGWRSERGLLSTEFAILMPFVLIVALVAVFGIRLHQHGARTQAAADAAARAASYSADLRVAAERAADRAASRVCLGPVGLDFDWVAPEPGALRPGRVVVELTCKETFAEFGGLLAGRVRVAGATGVATIEYWRPR